MPSTSSKAAACATGSTGRDMVLYRPSEASGLDPIPMTITTRAHARSGVMRTSCTRVIKPSFDIIAPSTTWPRA